MFFFIILVLKVDYIQYLFSSQEHDFIKFYFLVNAKKIFILV